MNLSQHKQPNFFIVGAPKCATTALYTYLRDHPQIFMSHFKEPHFFSYDLRYPNRVETINDYLALFGESQPHHRYIGEASVHYLHSAVAISSIHEFAPNAKIIAMLRNPIDLVHSYHFQRLYSFQEDIEDFEVAWRLQPQRSKGEHIPPKCLEPQLLQYERIGRLGRQVEQLLTIFPSEQIKLILFDDLLNSTKAVYDDVLSFLGVESDNRTVFPNINESQAHYIPMLGELLMQPPLLFTRLRKVLWRMRIKGVGRLLIRLNSKTKKRQPISGEFRQELHQVFYEEITVLEQLLKRDLSHWH